MGHQTLRKELGDPFIAGKGIEIEAGLNSVHHTPIDKLYFYDKRDPVEFEQYFGSPPEYELIDLQKINSLFPNGMDFINCHHVIEHIDNPIPVLAEWSMLIREGGVLYFSIPSQYNSIEKGRMLTPFSHIVEDWLFERAISSYESKQHIHSFIDACTASGGAVTPWFANNTVQDFSKFILHDISNRDDHDLHWHTYDLPTIKSVVKIAFFISGYNAKIEMEHESDDSIYLAFRKEKLLYPPAELVEFYNNLKQRLENIGSILKIN